MEKITVENVNHPGRTERVDAAKYAAMRQALTAALNRADAPLEFAELKAAVLAELPEPLFPGGATAGWWVKTVQLDLEAKGLMARTVDRPLRFHLKDMHSDG
jgi:hypothetical protein